MSYPDGLSRRWVEENIAALRRAIWHGEDHLSRLEDELRWHEDAVALFSLDTETKSEAANADA